MRFHFPTTPFPKERPRFVKGRVYTPQNTVEFENKIKKYARDQMIVHQYDCIDVGCDVRFVFCFKKPNLTKHLFPSNGDLDNYVKAVSDALNGIAWTDDRLIASLSAVKQWSPTQDAFISVHINKL